MTLSPRAIFHPRQSKNESEKSLRSLNLELELSIHLVIQLESV